MRHLLFFPFLFLVINNSNAQLSDECKLQFGTNLAGLADWGTEVPFVDMMHTCREWYTKDIGNPNAAFDSGMANYLTYREDGYPTHIPQSVDSSSFQQKIVTIWAVTDGWEAGDYIVLYEGTGTLSFWGSYTNLQNPNSNRYTFTMDNPVGGILEMTIESSDINDPVHNIRIIRDVYEATYINQPFNPTWINLLSTFKSVRFMDWGQTNNWGLNHSWEWNDSTLHDWDERAKMNYYTWTTNKGVPYEMMIKLMNDYAIDGWVCVPHSASDNYISEMAKFFLDSLESNRKLTVEYSNEPWNWMFGQTQWLNQYGCIDEGVAWPEGTAPYIQNCLDLWTTEWSSQLNCLTRAVGVQTGWLDVAQRVANNVDAASFDAVAGTYYFGISESADSVLDVMGSSATAQDIATMVRNDWHVGQGHIQGIKDDVAAPLSKDFIFYEGGQHLTPTPFGEEPTYSQALLDIQIDSVMYDLYNEWFDFLRTLQSGEEPLNLMNFSFISSRSARYGSWGVLEYQYQDPAIEYAPKYEAILDNQNFNCVEELSVSKITGNHVGIVVFPNPTEDIITITGKEIQQVEIYDLKGQLMFEQGLNNHSNSINVSSLHNGLYVMKIYLVKDNETHYLNFVKN